MAQQGAVVKNAVNESVRPLAIFHYGKGHNPPTKRNIPKLVNDEKYSQHELRLGITLSP